MTDAEMRTENRWTRTRFEEIRRQTRLWLGEQYPERVGTLLNPVCPPEFLAEITALYRYNAAENPRCSIVFAPDEGDWILWGPLSEVIAAKVNRPVGPGPRLCLDPEEMYSALDGHMVEPGRAVDKTAGGNFWFYSGFCF